MTCEFGGYLVATSFATLYANSLYTLVLLRMPRPGTYAMGMRGKEGVYLPHLEAYTNPRSKAHFLRHAPAAPIAAFLCRTSFS